MRAASPQGVGRRRRAIPTLGERGRFALWCGSTLRVNWQGRRAVGAPDFKRRSRRFSEMGVRAVCVHKKEGLLPAPR